MVRCTPRQPQGFTLLELLVVIGIIALLAGLVLGAMRSVRRAAARAACLSNERQIGAAIFAYAADYDGVIPYGPKAPPATPTNFYPGTGDTTSLISLQNGAPVALGLLLDKYLAKTPRVLFCPGADQVEDEEAELAKVGSGQAQGDYYYRHGSSISLSDIATPPVADHIRLTHLGNNRQGSPIRALLMDQNYIAADWMAAFNVYTRTNHGHLTVNVLYSDGHGQTLDNSNGQFTVNPTLAFVSLDVILQAFETADQQ